MAVAARRVATALRPHAFAIGLALLAIGIAWAYAVTVLRHTRPMGLPLDDSYIYLTYAKQFGRAQPFSYYPGGGYSAGSTSVLWPMLLAPFWTLGARGHALVWVSFALCTALYAATVAGVWRLVRGFAGEVPGAVAGVVLLGIGPFAWTSLSGMEVAFASALIVATILLLRAQPAEGPPGRLLIACLAATSLSRPEATLLVLAIVGVAVINRARQRDVRSAAWWCTPLVVPALWLCANKLFAGQLFPNTGVAKSHFYLPGFDWTYWFDTVTTLSGRMLRSLFWDATSPLVMPRAFAVAWLVWAVRIVLWARRERRWLVGVLVLVSPFLLMLAVVASSGLWSFQNFRYIAPAFPLLVIPVGSAFLPLGETAWARRGAIVAAVIACGLFARAAVPGIRANALNFAQGAMDTNTQVVAIGRYLHAKLPEASVMFHDAGAIAYYGDGRVYDMLGLVTNYQAGIANNGPGARFEFLESLPEERRPTHFAYYPSWLGTNELYGEVLMNTPLRKGFAPNRTAGDGDMQVITARWDHLHTGERPLIDHAGWAVVDRLDIADLASERAHAWTGAIGRRKLGDPTARWSLMWREAVDRGLLLDGGRTIRGAREAFTITIDPGKPVRLVLRSGGPASHPHHDTIGKPVPLSIVDDAGRVLASQTLPTPAGVFVEIAFELPAGAPARVHVTATGPYRAFHWFVLQPERGAP